MNPTTPRDMLANALAMGAIFAIVMYYWTRDPVQAGIMAIIMAVTLYAGYWASNRVAARFARRVRPATAVIEPLARTTERPEHVQRRRTRRRPRGRQSANRD